MEWQPENDHIRLLTVYRLGRQEANQGFASLNFEAQTNHNNWQQQLIRTV